MYFILPAVGGLVDGRGVEGIWENRPRIDFDLVRVVEGKKERQFRVRGITCRVPLVWAENLKLADPGRFVSPWVSSSQ